MCIAPPLQAQNRNVFGQSFCIEFPLTCGDTTKMTVCQFFFPSSMPQYFPALESWLSGNSMFSYTDWIPRKLAEWKYWPLLKDTIPTHSSAAIINYVYEPLLILRRSLLDVFEPAKPASIIDGPAGQTCGRQTSTSPSFIFNTVISAVLPDKEVWIS